MTKSAELFFQVDISDDAMVAELNITPAYESDRQIQIDESYILDILEEKHITYGINHQVIQKIVDQSTEVQFPVIIAEGIKPKNGTDGEVIYQSNFSSKVDRTKGFDFREVMRIPNVQLGERLATITLPTDGEDGTNVFGETVRARDGQPVSIRAGKNVTFNEKDMSFYAEKEGQVSIINQAIEVNEVFIVNENLSMKIGNLDFVGTIIIHGDVPSGFTVKAEADIKVFGMVEAAILIAGGSIFVSEGFAGLNKGVLQARENVQIGYINQGQVHAGNSVYVENSVIQSEVVATHDIFCQRGSIIGGSLSVGKVIEAKDIGNRLNTETALNFGIDERVYQQEISLQDEKKKLEITLQQLNVLGKKLHEQLKLNPSHVKIRNTLDKQKRSKKAVEAKINQLEEQLLRINASLGNEDDTLLIVRNYLYPNVIVAFGKYKHKITSPRHQVLMKMENQEIVIEPLS